jgi:hypothetical protein
LAVGLSRFGELNRLESDVIERQAQDMPVEGSAPCNEEDVRFRCRACGTWISGPRAHIGHGAPCPTCHRWVVVPYECHHKEGGDPPVSLKVVDLEDEALGDVSEKKTPRWEIGLIGGRLRVPRRPRLAWIATLAVLALGYAVLRCAG